MAEEVLKLFGMWASPFSRRIELALKLKGIQYEYIEEDLSNKSLLLLKYNPVHKQIPVLVHNGKPIAESLVILQYIEETWKTNPLLPEDPYDRAMARFWSNFIDDKLLQTIQKACVGKKEEQEKACEEVYEQLKMLENELKGKDFFGGNTVGYLDIVAIMIAFWLEVVQEAAGLELINEEKFPILLKWSRNLGAIEAANECRPPREKLVDVYRAKIEATKLASK
ncbi:glutathione S-transferase U8-like [Tripterygium wilfordii]|uniref:glutathione S-transferase U8-like n=1 Tax=Tripterygium wilfordii TaxID=458696 RepID=UPI0018F7F37F|nr:glutathione S-transferase U8-like [Tripterygium wilfordii]